MIPEAYRKAIDAGDEVPGIFPITPSNPKAFETRAVGFKCEIEATQNAGEGLEMNIALEDSHFLGFINYGSAISGTAKTSSASRSMSS